MDGEEIALWDRRRRPPRWTEIIRPHQCAVFLRDRVDGAISRDGTVTPAEGATCILFDSIADMVAAALRFLLWESAAKSNERTRNESVAAHRRRESLPVARAAEGN